MSDSLIWFYRSSAGTEGLCGSGPSPASGPDYCLHLNIHLSQSPLRIHLFHRGSITSHHLNPPRPPTPPLQKKKKQHFFFFFFPGAIKQIFLFGLGVGRGCLAGVTVLIRHCLRPITNWLFAKWLSRLDGWHVECFSPLKCCAGWKTWGHESAFWLRFLWIQSRPCWLFSLLTPLCLSPPLSLSLSLSLYPLCSVIAER